METIKEEKKAEYVERGNVLKTMCIGNEMDAFGNLTCEQKAIIMLIQENTRLKEEVEELKKENKNLKKELSKYKKYYDRDKEELMESCYSLAKENDKLKSDLSECECSLGFENDEVGFWKLEYKRLKKRIKDHCKGYGNLFPEDEMKRQRKKADKKRKKEEIRVSRDEHSYDDIFGDDELKKKTKLFEGEYKHIPKKL